ncbi:MAG TPA: PfkB family carbohydrate kinase [Armatimonadota bacterium]|jgi:sugar/nucleoside kinase (ribokinase family)
MKSASPILVYGPAYLDLVLEIDRPLLLGTLLDQSLPAAHITHAEGETLQVLGPTGDRLAFHLPPGCGDAATYHLSEPVLARLQGEGTEQIITGEYPAVCVRRQLGGMGAGYAMALHGLLRSPIGLQRGRPEAVGAQVLEEFARYGIRHQPCLLPDCPSDTSLIILSARGDKLAIGLRQAMVRWRATDDDRALAAQADAFVFCGAPNALMAEVLCHGSTAPVMCAPAMRNVVDTEVPLAGLASRIHYLTLNALEWAHLAGKERLRELVPVISVTDGPRGSRVFFSGDELAITAIPRTQPANTNRAGETYGATFFRTLLRECPDFMRPGKMPASLVELAAQLATVQAARQLDLEGFAFPPEEDQ